MLYHVGLDVTGHRHRRMRSQDEVRRHRERKLLRPTIVFVVASKPIVGPCQARWRNALQRRRFMMLTEQVRGDRRCFLMTLKRPPFVPPVRPF